MRKIVSPLDGVISPLGIRIQSGSVIPTGAIKQRDGGYILDRAGNYIEVRA